MSRRLPVYILIDTSGSMRGEPIEAVKVGLSDMIASLRVDPFALETVCISIITFDRSVQQVLPLTELARLQVPDIQCPESGPTFLGGALQLLCERYDKELRPGSPERKGDWMPLLFVLTDGKPSDVQDYARGVEAVKNGVDMLVSTLLSDPYALETAYLSVITFDSAAQQLVPLTELPKFQAPQLQAAGCTALGGALALLAQRIDTEVTTTTAEQKGDWRPLVFIMTDGKPTDDLQFGLEQFRQRKTGMVVACAAGQGADTATLQQITPNVVQLATADSGTIKAFFKWVSASISTSSKAVENAAKETTSFSELPPPPPEVNIVI